MKALVFRGDGKSGKTLLMERAVRELRRRGYRVGVVKHCPHLHPEGERNDSGRMLRAGAGGVLLLADQVDVLYRPACHPRPETGPGTAGGDERGEARGGHTVSGQDHTDALRLHDALHGLDQEYVLVEGFKSYPGPLPSLVFVRTPERMRELGAGHTVACSGPAELEEDARSLGLVFFPLAADGGSLADFIERHAVPPPAGP
ncbi:MAG: molybdopterin-guanine dinucleotide biosynthesis protein B [Spirochaetota bacterium]